MWVGKGWGGEVLTRKGIPREDRCLSLKSSTQAFPIDPKAPLPESAGGGTGGGGDTGIDIYIPLRIRGQPGSTTQVGGTIVGLAELLTCPPTSPALPK